MGQVIQPRDGDVALFNEGDIVVIPLVCNEHNNQLLS